MDDLIIGSHVSFTKQTGLLGSIKEATGYKANTFMFYTGAPQNTNRAPIDLEITSLAMKALKEENINSEHIIVHAPYIINLANPTNFDFSVRFLKQEIERVEMLGMTKLVLHPGSHVGLGTEKGIENIIRALNTVIDEKTHVDILLETMAGKGTECGKNFTEIRSIIEGVKHKDKIKVCLDTCHISDAGYDLTHFDDVLEEFDKKIGIEKLACIHINDSLNERGSHKDRHANFGFGKIGFDTLIEIVYHEKLKKVPKILETPYITKDDTSKEKIYPPYLFEIEMIRKRKWDENLFSKIRAFYK